ncbi:MAG: exodeoxyribonuclease V subunit gamma [Chromatiales bacterium]|nr:exodeoxyribonuclease V subunit gamma [Chromatiales bacterium]
MLHLHHGNRLETLRERLATITATPLAEVFAAEQIVVQNPGMARWLAQGLAEAHGVAANLEFLLPASFVWEVFRGQFERVPEQSAFAAEALTWRIHARLPALLDHAAFAAPRRYLRDDDDGRKRLQLASRVAGLFDQYLIYRPDLIFAWERGAEADDWQAELWRELVGELGPHHRAGLLRDLRDRPGGLDIAKLPERVCLFGITALAPTYLDIFTAIAEHTEVHVFLLSPSFQWWGDLVAERDQARRRDAARQLGVAPESVGEATRDNRLLATLAAQGREFYKALTERAGDDSEHYAPPAALSLLGTLQLDLLFLQERGGADGEPRMPVDADDRSLQIHSCHGPIREVQVLHDRLLDLFERLPDLHARDIVVMAPEIGTYAPLIEAVFGGAPEARRIPFSIADLGATGHDEPLIQTFLALLQLPRDRLAVGSVLGWLNVPAFARRAGLPVESLPRIGQWLRDSGVRWGRDAAHRRRFGVDGEDTHTWAFGLRRLLLGYAMFGAEPADQLVAGVAPHPDIEGMEAAWLGQLIELIERLGRWAEALAVPATPGEWLKRLPRLLDDFFAFTPDEDDAEQRLRAAFGDWAGQLETGGLLIDGQDHDPTGLSFGVVHAHLGTLIGELTADHRFLNGAVTFCNMLPMRSIPFRVVCLLGMNDTDYPRRQPQLGFDRIAQKPRAGDRSRRDDDHTLFLEALLSARDCLYISYVGNDARDDSARNPSVLVAELIETIERGFELPGTLVRRHPLQPFSSANFRAPHGSYAAEWQPGNVTPAPLFASDLRLAPPDEPDEVLTLDELRAFFRNPAEHFLRERFGLRLFGDAAIADDSEAFDLGGLDAWRLRGRLLAARVDDADEHADLALLRALGELPHGPFGALAAARIEAEAEEIADRVRSALHGATEREVDLTLDDGTRLTGSLHHIGGDAMLRYQAGKLSARGRLAMWIDHLALNALADAPVRATRLIGKDGDETYEAIDDARARLTDLVAIYRAGRTQPLPLFPDSAFAYASKDDTDEALAAAEAQWLGGDWVEAEGDKPVNAFVFRDRDPLRDGDAATGFAALAEAVFAPLRAAKQDKRRKARS